MMSAHQMLWLYDDVEKDHGESMSIGFIGCAYDTGYESASGSWRRLATKGVSVIMKDVIVITIQTRRRYSNYDTN